MILLVQNYQLYKPPTAQTIKLVYYSIAIEQIVNKHKLGISRSRLLSLRSLKFSSLKAPLETKNRPVLVCQQKRVDFIYSYKNQAPLPWQGSALNN